jgi:hypothetical protein
MRNVTSGIVTLAAACVLTGCTSASAVSPTDTIDGGGNGSDPLAAYFITPALCTAAGGPDCSRLPLGDSRLSTTTPARGTLYSCVAANPNAPGSVRSRITWIDASAGTWDLLRKPWLPAGAFSPAQGSYTATEQGGNRTIQVNDLPIDRKIGNWPMTAYPLLTAIDANPGVPAARSYTFTLPVAPSSAATPGCLPLGAIGVTVNGVVLYNAADARGNDALAHEIVDVYGGHPAMSDYHYHFLPERFDTERLPDGHSGIAGYIRDGFTLYGYQGVGGIEMTNADLDECHGHSHGTLGYHYHATIEYPYTVGCYRGVPR